MAPIAIAFLILAGVIAIPFAIFAIVYLIVPVAKGIGWLFMQLFNFIAGEIGDLLRIVGSIATSIVLIPLTIVNVLIGRWSASAHYGRAIQAECLSIGRSLYRIAIGHPAKLLCLTPLTEGLEKRIPEVVAAAPGSDRPSKRLGQFDGYTIVGSLPGGGLGRSALHCRAKPGEGRRLRPPGPDIGRPCRHQELFARRWQHAPADRP